MAEILCFVMNLSYICRNLFIRYVFCIDSFKIAFGVGLFLHLYITMTGLEVNAPTFKIKQLLSVRG